MWRREPILEKEFRGYKTILIDETLIIHRLLEREDFGSNAASPRCIVQLICIRRRPNGSSRILEQVRQYPVLWKDQLIGCDYFREPLLPIRLPIAYQ